MRLFKAKDTTDQALCDTCETPIKVQVVDLVQGVDIMHCPKCYKRWEVPHAVPQEAVA